MSQHVLLNSIDHKDLKVITTRSAALGDNLWFSLTFPQEFRSVQAHYPIFFHKDTATGQFYSVALFGFQQNDNVFLSDQGWSASYVPLTVRRQPFLIGQQTVLEDGVERQQRVIHVDLDHPRVSESEGEALFLPYGGNTPLLDEVGEILEVIHHGLQDGQRFVDALIEYQLLESFTLDIELDNGQKKSDDRFLHHQRRNLSRFVCRRISKATSTRLLASYLYDISLTKQCTRLT